MKTPRIQDLTPPVFTIGHSTQPVEPFIAALEAHGIALLVDVRRFPASRRHPQYNEAALAAVLHEHGIAYLHLPALGGRRAPRPDSRNTAWRNASFRGYADHMETPECQTAIARVVAVMVGRRSDYRTGHPGPADVLLVVEVSDSSLSFDRRDKLRIYAAAGLATYWIVNLSDETVEVYTSPQSQHGSYGQRNDVRRGDRLTLDFAGTVLGLAVSEILV